MRFHELIEAAQVGIADARINAVKLPLRKSDFKNHLHPQSVPIVLRLMPTVYRQLELRIVHGDPDASIDIKDAWVSFPEPYNETGDISVHCRRWITEMVRDAAMGLGFRMCILFDDGPIYVRADGELVTGRGAPEGGMRL